MKPGVYRLIYLKNYKEKLGMCCEPEREVISVFLDNVRTFSHLSSYTDISFSLLLQFPPSC